MNAEHKCSRAGINTSSIMTKTRFGHGDSSHECYVICETCGKMGEKFSYYGVFADETLRKAQKSWDNELGYN